MRGFSPFAGRLGAGAAAAGSRGTVCNTPRSTVLYSPYNGVGYDLARFPGQPRLSRVRSRTAEARLALVDDTLRLAFRARQVADRHQLHLGTHADPGSQRLRHAFADVDLAV